jgi:hypothetical protein
MREHEDYMGLLADQWRARVGEPEAEPDLALLALWAAGEIDRLRAALLDACAYLDRHAESWDLEGFDGNATRTRQEAARLRALAPKPAPEPRNCYETRGWHGARNSKGKCPDCGDLLPPGPPDSPRPKRPDVS